MFNIKAHKPQNKIRFYVYHCDKCQESMPYPRESEKCMECETKHKLAGSFWVQAEMILPREMDEFIKSATETTSFFDIFDRKIKDWGEISSDDTEFPCTSENRRLFYDSQPAIADYIVGYLQQRDLFGMIGLAEFKKKLKTRKNGSLPTQKRRKSPQTVEDV